MFDGKQIQFKNWINLINGNTKSLKFPELETIRFTAPFVEQKC